MKNIFKKFLYFFTFLVAANSSAQQLPDYSQYPSMLWQLNPAYTGTKATIDARINYRKQWVGFSGAPVANFAGINSRLWKGRIGLGTTMYKDVTGPSERVNYGFTAAYHLRLPDVEFSIGFGANFNKYILSIADSFHILQGNDSFFYQNMRIIKNNGLYSYSGVTHEYINTPSDNITSFIEKQTLFIRDIGDGGSKNDKFERDIKLLLDGIKEEPKNERYYFYLSNS